MKTRRIDQVFVLAMAAALLVPMAGETQTVTAVPGPAPQEDAQATSQTPDTEGEVSTEEEQATAANQGQRFAGEIVVTARRRAENIQDVAMAISALDNLQLEQAGVNDFDSFARMLPGLNYLDAGSGKKKLAIRGLSDGRDFDNLIQSTVAVYLDDLPFTSSVTIPDLHMFDIERLEVLRGPQGTLYGAGSLGGTLRMITTKPSLGRFEGKIDATAATTSGGDPSYALNGAFNIPMGEKAALRLVAYTKDDGGYVDNVRLGIENWNNVKTNGGRVAFRWEPTEKFGLTASAVLQKSDVEGKAWYAPSQGDLRIDVPVPETIDDRLNVYNLTLNYDFGWAELSSISAYYDGTNDWLFEFSENAFLVIMPLYLVSGLEPISDHHYDQEFDIFTQEFRLVSQGTGPWRWTTGLFYSKNDEPLLQTVLADNLSTLFAPVFPPAFLEPGGPFYVGDDVVFIGGTDYVVTQLAMYGDVSYDFSDRWAVTVGARWFDFNVDTAGWSIGIQNIVQGVGDPTNKGYSAYSGSTSDSSVNPKFGLDFRLNDSVLFYGSATKGFRIGGVNSQLAVGSGAPADYGSDSLWAYEFGFKTTIGGNRATLNGALYYNDWNDIQTKQLLPNGFGYRDNAGKAGVLGLELSSDWMITQNLNLNAYVDVRQTELREDFVDGASGELLGKTGDRLIGIPDLAVGAALQYYKPLTNNLNFTTRLDFQHVGESFMFYEVQATEKDSIGDYNVVNLRLGLLLASQGLEFTIFGNNLTDERARISVSNLVDERVFTIRPLTVGATVRFFF
jgi:iron complex outermembrane receptor protein